MLCRLSNVSTLIARISYVLFVLTLAVATFVEWRTSTDFSYQNIYGAWWFAALIFVCGTSAALIVLRALRKRKAALLLHFALLMILLGALVTKLFGVQGQIHLRKDSVPHSVFVTTDGSLCKLPFSLKLNEFELICYPATNTPLDYRSLVSINDTVLHEVSMNKVLTIRHFRFYQSGYDPDLQGSTLIVNHDPVGIAISYSGYLLLAVAFISVLINRRGRYRAILRRLRTEAAAVAAACLFTSCSDVSPSLPTFERNSAIDICDSTLVLYHGRLSPLTTYAHDFLLKLSESRSWCGFEPEQVLLGFACFPEEWLDVPILKNESDLLREFSSESEYLSVNMLLSSDCQTVIQKYWRNKKVQEVCERAQLALSVADGEALRVFPLPQAKEKVDWLASADSLIFNEKRSFVGSFWKRLALSVISEDCLEVNKLHTELNILQHSVLQNDSLRRWRVGLENHITRINLVSWLWRFSLCSGFLLVFSLIVFSAKTNLIKSLSASILSLLLIFQILNLALRVFVSGQLPMATGYETMLFLALIISVLGLIVKRISPVLVPVSVLLVGFALLVADLGLRNPAITLLMPVLHSPWLSLHVATVMMAYALLLLSFVNSFISVICRSQSERQIDLSLAFIYPATALLSVGIFVGAVWANESWGRYWAWDPKEVWALITLLVYVVPLHPSLIGRLAVGKAIHIYIIVSFLTVIMTYFGVNYLLGGMHSYGG